MLRYTRALAKHSLFPGLHVSKSVLGLTFIYVACFFVLLCVVVVVEDQPPKTSKNVTRLQVSEEDTSRVTIIVIKMAHITKHDRKE